MKPIVLAMIICDHYYHDGHTGKSILSGIFSTINCTEFPSIHGNCAIYIVLSDVKTEGEVQITFKKEGGEFLMKLPPWEVKRPKNDKAVIEIGGNINSLPLSEEGDYKFIISWNGVEIASRRLRALQIKMPQESDNPKDDSNIKHDNTEATNDYLTRDLSADDSDTENTK